MKAYERNGQGKGDLVYDQNWFGASALWTTGNQTKLWSDGAPIVTGIGTMSLMGKDFSVGSGKKWITDNMTLTQEV